MRLAHDTFPSAAHLASWAGIFPGNDESAGKTRSGKTRRGSVWLRTELTIAAKAAARTKGTYLAAHHARIKARRGWAKAVGATRHDILVAFYPSSETRSPTVTWEPTGTNSATPPSTAPAGWSASSNAPATRSPSNPPPDRAFTAAGDA